MKKAIFLFSCLVFGLYISEIKAQPGELVVADFDKGEKPNNLGEDFGTWDGFPNDSTQGCKMKFVETDALGKQGGKSIRLDYDVDSPNSAYNGFWMRIKEAEVLTFETLSFYIKGDTQIGFTQNIKIELKDKRKGKAAFFVKHITDKWQKISLTLDSKNIDQSQKKPFEEFVIVFDDINCLPKVGRIYLDQIEFSKN